MQQPPDHHPNTPRRDHRLLTNHHHLLHFKPTPTPQLYLDRSSTTMIRPDHLQPQSQTTIFFIFKPQLHHTQHTTIRPSTTDAQPNNRSDQPPTRAQPPPKTPPQQPITIFPWPSPWTRHRALLSVPLAALGVAHRHLLRIPLDALVAPYGHPFPTPL